MGQLVAGHTGTDKAAEQGVTVPWRRRKFGVELAGDKPGVIRNFDDFYQIILDRAPGNQQHLQYQR